MDLEARKLSLVKALLSVEKEEVVLAIESFLTKHHAAIDTMGSLTLEGLNADIDLALQDAEAGRLMAAQELLTKLNEWK